MATSAVWFGGQRPDLFGWVGRPSPTATAPGVVLCPPIGRDAANSHYTYRLLSEQLVEAGLITVRFDYAGTGDSIGDSLGAHLVEDWLASIESAVALARSAGATSISLVGLRVGALLVEHIAERMTGLRSLVLWDPVVSGRAFVRSQRALELLREGGDGSAVNHSAIPWLDMSPEGLEELKSLTAPKETRRQPIPTLLLARPDDGNIDRVVERLAGQPVERRTVTGQYELIDMDPVANQVPEETVTTLVDWFRTTLLAPGSQTPEGATVAAAPVVSADHTVVEPESPHGPVRESVVRLGPAGLFGIETVPEQPDPKLPKIVFLNSGRVSHVSPGRIWVRLARTWAAMGFQCLRFDLSSLGDSAPRPGQGHQLAASIEAFQDIEEAVQAFSPEDPRNIVMVGLSSGGYHALELGLTLKPRAICVINPVVVFNPPETEHGRMDPRRRVCIPKSKMEAVAAERITIPWIYRILVRLAWIKRQLLYRNQVQSVWLREMVESGVRVYGICAAVEALQLLGDARLSLPELAPTGRLRVDVVDGLDHALIPQDHQALVANTLTAYLSDEFLAHRDLSREPVSALTVDDAPPD